MSENRIVWSDELGDLRKKKTVEKEKSIDEKSIFLNLRRLTSGKGRVIVEISNLPQNKNWCKKMAKDLKKSLGVGGAYKNDLIEIHGEKIKEVMAFLEQRSIGCKKIGG